MQNHRLATIALGCAFAFAGVQAWAGGNITSINPNKTTLDFGQSLTVDVGGTIALDQFKRGCGIRVTMMYEDNSTEVAHAGMATNFFPMTGIYVKPSKAGNVKITADGAAVNMPVGTYPGCTGIHTVMVQAKVVPVMKMTGPPSMQLAQSQNVQIAATQIAPPATLTGLKQVPYTDQGGETWLEVSGTGTCDYTIQGAGLAPVEFASSAAKPFPMKVKVPGAPTGSYNWTATGKGSCKGTASGNANVQP